MKSIVLVGMPGCGKSSIGKLLAGALNRRFYDSDLIIETERNKTINQIFETEGEPFFRTVEAEVIKRLSTLKNAVISTGGGAVLNRENVNFLKQENIIIFINRPIELIITDIETGSRPLLKAGTERLYKLYEERLPLYRACADIEIENNDSMPRVTEKIMACLR